MRYATPLIIDTAWAVCHPVAWPSALPYGEGATWVVGTAQEGVVLSTARNKGAAASWTLSRIYLCLNSTLGLLYVADVLLVRDSLPDIGGL